MTYGEKYTTAAERTKAMRSYCKKQNCCTLCPISKKKNKCCQFEWLNLEISAEKPNLCPFCYGYTMWFKVLGKYSIQCTKCEYQSKAYSTLEEAIHYHNILTERDHKMKTTKKQINQTKNSDKFVTILSIKESEGCTAFYNCSDGNIYYDPMYTHNNYVGDKINPENYQLCKS